MIYLPTYQYGLRAAAKKVLNMERNRFDHAYLNVLHYFTVNYDIIRICHGLRRAYYYYSDGGGVRGEGRFVADSDEKIYEN